VTPARLDPETLERAPVVVHTPTGRDAALVAELLQAHGHVVERTSSGPELALRLCEPVGVVVLAEEALLPETTRALHQHLQAQPSWSDLPLVILTSPARAPRPTAIALDELRAAGNVTLLERPVQPVTLLSAVRAGLRARARQLQVQQYLEERIRAEEMVRRRQRIEAVGKLAGGVAHEVNNMMTAVLGFSEMALRRLAADAPAAADIREVVKAGTRTARITQQLLAFTRQQINQPESLSVPAVLHELVHLLKQSLGAEYDLRFQIPAEVPVVRADRTQLEQVIINLVLNARDATPSGGTISIVVDTVALDGMYGERHSDVAFRPGDYVLLAVSDTGAGMDQGTMDRAFEPFYTTKPVGQGTGLGLSTVYGIVKQSHGYVWLYSEPGHGTTVKIYLPTGSVGAPADGRGARAPSGGQERVLVIEDEDLVRQVTRRSLEEYGYQVIEAPNGQAAVELLRREPPVDLILCDIVMPGLAGPALAAALAREAPGARMLYMSGYTGLDVELRRLAQPSAPFIQKPFRAEDLAAKVRALLDGAPDGRPSGARLSILE
jgi:two-component system, cell cycle sensor histidine kinase and response regulator CckA